MKEIIDIIKNNNKFCRDIIFLYPHLEKTIKLFKKSPNVDHIRKTLEKEIEIIANDTEIINLLSKSKNINNNNPVDVRGSVYRINSNSDDFKKLIDYANENNWRYNTFSVLKEENKWLIFFG